MRDLFEDDDIELEDAVEIMPKNEASQKFALERGNVKECYPLKISETGEELLVTESDHLVCVYNEAEYKKKPNKKKITIFPHPIAEAGFRPNGELISVAQIESKYRNLKIGDFVIRTAIQKHGCWWLKCNGDKAYRIYRKYGLLPIYNGYVFDFGSPSEFKDKIKEYYPEGLKEHFENTLNGTLRMSKIVIMCDKAHLSEFGLEWSPELEKFVNFMDANYKGFVLHDSKKTYCYEFVEDTIEVVPTPKEESDIWGDYTTLEIKETGEKLMVVNHSTEGILIYPVKGNVKKSIAHIDVKEEGYILNYYVAPDYRKYGLGKYLLEKALNEYHGWWLLCGGTTAYKLYRKYGFVPVANYGIKVAPKDDKTIKACLNVIKNAPARNEKVSEIVTMVLKDHLEDVGLTWNEDLERFAKYVDANYHGEHDSGKYVFEKVDD